MLARGHRLQVGQQGMVGYVTSSGKPRIALNVGADAVFFNNPDLPETRSETCLPLKVNEVVIGALDIQSTEANAFTEEDYSVLSILADQVAIAVQNAKANEETKRALQEAEIASSQLTGHAWKEYSFGREVKGYQFRGLKAEPIESKPSNSEANGLINVPIRSRGQIIGNLKLNRTDERYSWTDDELAMVQATADRVALALESARLFDETSRRAERERMVTEITSKIRSTNNPEEMINVALNELRSALGATHVQLIPQTISAAKEDKTMKTSEVSQKADSVHNGNGANQ